MKWGKKYKIPNNRLIYMQSVSPNYMKLSCFSPPGHILQESRAYHVSDNNLANLNVYLYFNWPSGWCSTVSRPVLAGCIRGFWAWVGEPNLDIAGMAGISADKLSVRALVKDKSQWGTWEIVTFNLSVQYLEPMAEQLVLEFGFWHWSGSSF